MALQMRQKSLGVGDDKEKAEEQIRAGKEQVRLVHSST
jgi:hypothetical protein